MKPVHPGKSAPIKMNQYEAALIVSQGQAISILGPFGTVFVERSKDSKDREMFVIIADEEITVRRTVKEAVDMGLHLAGLSVGSQIEGTVHSIGSAGLKAIDTGSRLLGNSLYAAAGAFVKIGSFLIK